ncbi:pyocin activator PrtN family protein [Aliivibrio fischeri]|uniref:pyocin activator PrtN family protein n=1 Tax=Aliivibrio fischeri TaxID=668 RepID=UPI00084C59BC|nr:pyocin activator PrtN family protein [Aliivibrio fischeri]MUK76177.1 pyocin activator protein PrtN [Aliivibrio fischeri]OED52865.1 pyocin activator protein PrtN [Aliivibrio fischeri]
MNTAFALAFRFGSTVVPLKDVSEEFLGITPKTANSRANAGDLEIPVFQLRESTKSPYLVKIEDLAFYIDDCHRKAKAEWQSADPSREFFGQA